MKFFKTCLLKLILIAWSNWKYKRDFIFIFLLDYLLFLVLFIFFLRQKISGFCMESKILKWYFPVVIIITIKKSSHLQVHKFLIPLEREWMSQSNKLTWNLRKKKKCLQGKENMNTCLLGVDDYGNQYEELSRNS